MSETNKYSLEGRVNAVMDAQTYGSGFEKREFVVTIDGSGKYPQEIKQECVHGNVAILDDVRVGDEVKAWFNLRGSEYKGRYYTNMQCWKIEVLSRGSAEAAIAGGDNPPAEPSVENEGEIPF